MAAVRQITVSIIHLDDPSRCQSSRFDKQSGNKNHVYAKGCRYGRSLALQMKLVGDTKASAATVTRMQLVLENEYVP
ncbi:hypothetical protein EZV62_007048 [Acer yangbiense]|uniref:Uncharacterized protein n=1 Tax=Acer yangbiense TaxID=1000413 RepID=A0A5C7I872_9ROSI|nr:hypothetical protein EZV62_007048 [Acer yangbiense]